MCASKSLGSLGHRQPSPRRIRPGTLEHLVPCSGAPCFQQGRLRSDIAVLSQLYVDMLERN